ncbi:unnamed protein product [Penicillium camemberti]|uniref:Str. FM013 n=1 Tax=Penicillium camemberti (strain FM 013) TaxID=1429867 RepID=A0A0G4PPK1_PENC3|nr:unnamed protein product [Penicillium camemberti]
MPISLVQIYVGYTELYLDMYFPPLIAVTFTCREYGEGVPVHVDRSK